MAPHSGGGGHSPRPAEHRAPPRPASLMRPLLFLFSEVPPNLLRRQGFLLPVALNAEKTVSIKEAEYVKESGRGSIFLPGVCRVPDVFNAWDKALCPLPTWLLQVFEFQIPGFTGESAGLSDHHSPTRGLSSLVCPVGGRATRCCVSMLPGESGRVGLRAAFCFSSNSCPPGGHERRGQGVFRLAVIL